MLLELIREMFLRLKTLWKEWIRWNMCMRHEILTYFCTAWMRKTLGTIEFE